MTMKHCSSAMALCAFTLAVAAPLAYAQEHPVLDAPGLQQNRDYFSQMPFERIDTLTGALILTFTDLVVPGNAGRELRFQRTYNSKNRGWTFGVAGIPLFVSDPAYPVLHPPDPQAVTPALHMSDGSTRKMAWATLPDLDNQQSFDETISSEFWRYHRPSRALRMPDGTTCWYEDTGATLLRVTECRDPFHTGIDFEWLPATLNITQVLSDTQERLITLTYPDGPVIPISLDFPVSMAFGDRVWTYTRTEAHPPEGPSWLYAYDGHDLTSVTTPHGGIVQYSYADQSYDTQPGENIRQTRVVSRRETGGQGIEQGVWTYTYDISQDGLSGITVVKTPTSEIRYGHGTSPELAEFVFDGQAGLVPLVSRFVYGFDEHGVWGELEREENTYDLEDVLEWRQFGTLELQRRKITRSSRNPSNGVISKRTFTTDFEYGPYHEPTRIIETGTAGTRITDRMYDHLDDPESPPYILALLTEETVAVGQSSYTRSWVYDENTGFRTRETVYGVTTEFGPDGNGNVATVTKGNGKETTSDYSWGAVSAIYTPEYAITRAINSDGTVRSETRGGRTTEFAYDDMFRVTRAQPPGSAPILTEYDNDAGRTIEVSRGQAVTTTTLDGFGRPILTENGSGIQTSTRYDAEGRKTYEGYPFAGTTDRGVIIEYDGLGRVARRINPDQSAVTFNYGAESVTVTDEQQRATVLTQRAFGDPDETRLDRVRDAASKDWTYVYNALGKLTRVTGPPGPNGEAIIREWVYDARNLLTLETHPESGPVEYRYDDGAGNLTYKRDVLGRELTYEYDGNDRLSRIVADGRVTSFTYEPGTDNRATAATDQILAMLAYEDASGRLQSRLDTIDGRVYGQVLEYDDNDNITALTYPSGRRVQYSYDSENRIAAIVELPPNARTFADAFAYHPSGAITTFRSGNGIVNGASYDDQRYWPRIISAGALYLDYSSYDSVGNVLTINDSRGTNFRQTFVYDKLHRLKTSTGPIGQTSYTYDAHGNRTGGGFAYETGTLRLRATPNGTLTYDVAGNLRAGPRAADTYTYTPENLLETATVDGVASSYIYDADGLRAKAVTPDATSVYLRGPSGELLTELRTASGSTIARDYIYAGTRLVAVVEAPFDENTPPPGGGLAAPANLRHRVVGQTVTLEWDAVVGATSYLVEAGSASGLADLVVVSWSTTTLTVPDVPPGRYYVRVRAVSGSATSAPSNEIVVDVSDGSVPPPPGNLRARVEGNSVVVTWDAVPGAISYILEAGSATGLADIATIETNVPTLAVPNVPPGVYYVRVRAISPAGPSAPSAEIVIAVDNESPSGWPPPPTNLQAAVSGRSVRVAWDAVESATAYVLEAGTVTGASDVYVIQTPETSLSAQDVAPGTYFVRVRSVAPQGTSVPSREIVVVVDDGPPTGAPSIPINLRAAVAGAAVTITWDSVSGATSYLLEAGTVPGATNVAVLALSEPRLAIADMQPGTYYVRVRAVSPSGTSIASREIVVSIDGGPASVPVPADVQATVNGSVVTVTWDEVAGASGYVVETGTAPGATDVSTLETPAPPFSIVNLSPGTYTIRVRTIAGNLTSAASGEVIVTVTNDPSGPPPANLRATVVGGDVTVMWDAAPGASSYMLEAGTAPGLSDFANVPTSAVSLTFQGLAPGTYYARVRAVSAQGTSGPSNEIQIVVTGLAAPTNLRATVEGQDVTLAWDAAPGASSYMLEAGTAPGLSNFANVPTGAVSLTFEGVAPGTYYARVRAVSAQGTSGPSNEIQIMITGLAAPTNLRATVAGQDLTLAWDAAPGASSYMLEAGTSPGLSNFANVPTSAVSMTLGGVATGTYYVRVRAVSGQGTSGPSNEITVTVLAAPTNLQGSVTGRDATLTWQAAAGAASYLVEAGTTPGGSDAATLSTTALILTVTNLTPGTYYVRVRAVSSSGTSGPSNEITVTIQPPPPAPANLRVTAISGTSVTVAWDAVATASSYVVEAGTAPGATNAGTITSTTTSATANLSPGTYYVRVRAVSSQGTSGLSNEITVTMQPPPPAPANLRVTAVSGTSVTVAWDAVATASSYVVEAGTAPGATNAGMITATTTSATANLSPGTYYVRVRAVSSQGTSSPSNEISVTIQQPPPPAPGNLRVTAVSGTSVTVAWDAVAGASSYVVEAGTAPGATNAGTITATTTSAAANLSPGTYYVRVRAVSATGTSAPSNEIAVTTYGPPPAPANLRVTGVNGTTVSVAWDPVSEATSYQVEVGTASGASDVTVQQTGATSYSGTLAPGTYYVRVRAISPHGMSGPSNEISGTVDNPPPPPPPPPPPAPGNLRVTGVNGTTISVEWDSVAEATSYQLEVGTAPGASDVTVIQTSGTGYTGTLAPGTYYVRVRAMSSSGTSGPSNEISGTVQ